MTKRNYSYESEVKLTMEGENLLKKASIRNAEYYNMVEILDKLYADSKNGRIFTDLVSVISSEDNIKMAYRNLKNNKGSQTAGVDGLTFENLNGVPDGVLVCKVKEKIQNYQPKAVRRVYIPKPNGKQRPLGIPTVLDRLVQQSVLQIMEPICEAKFYDKSYGFRPNRSTNNAIAMCYKYAQQDGYHYVVDVDIKGFFDNVDHAKLIKQIWALGIHDKNLICLIGKMLKAPIEYKGEREIPTKGTPQGGVLSPLLANIVLNELDWWIASQWELMPMKKPCKSDVLKNKNGSDNRGYQYKRLRETSKLKDCHIVRYADDFKIFCKNYSDACKLKAATEQWLLERLKLETSEEKSRITNLKVNYSEFLGIKFKLYKKGTKWVIKSHMTEKALASQQKKLKVAMLNLKGAHASKQLQHRDTTTYNQMVVGMHQYYSMATMICEDVHKLFPPLHLTLKHASSVNKVSREPPERLYDGMDEFFYECYKDSKQVRFINGLIIVPVAYCKTKNPMCHSPSVNRYTASGRELIHKMLQKDEYYDVLANLSKTNIPNESIEFHDNMISRFVASKGKCELCKKHLVLDDVACLRIKPKEEGGTDEYKNLRIVHKDVLELRNTDDVTVIKRIISELNISESSERQKINKWRNRIGKENIQFGNL